MKCQYSDPPGAVCSNVAELMPVLEMRAGWDVPPAMCGIGKMGTCCAHAAGLPLLAIVPLIDFESIARSVEQRGMKRPDARYTTLCWKPIPPEFEPHVADDTKRTNGVLKRPGIILPGQQRPN